MRDAGGDVIGVDWRIELDAARRRLGDGVALQGNLDPVALLAPWESLKPRAQHTLDQMAGRAGYSSIWGMASYRRRRSRTWRDWWSLSMSIRRAATPMQTETDVSGETGAHVVIVGGGIAGLSAAWYLQREAARQSIPVRYTVMEDVRSLGREDPQRAHRGRRRRPDDHRGRAGQLSDAQTLGARACARTGRWTIISSISTRVACGHIRCCTTGSFHCPQAGTARASALGAVLTIAAVFFRGKAAHLPGAADSAAS